MKLKGENMIEKNVQFLEAVENGDKEKVINLVNKDPTLLKYTMEDGFTAIHLASLEGHNEVIEYLISKGMNVNVETNEGETAIHLAAYEGYNQTIELLCRNGAIFSPLEVYENLLEGIKLKIIEDKDFIKAIIYNSMQVLEEFRLIEPNAIEDSTNSEVLENMLVNDLKNHSFIVPVIDNFIKKKINIENLSLQDNDLEIMLNNLHSKNRYSSYYKCLYFLIENGLRLDHIIPIIETIDKKQQEDKKIKIETPVEEKGEGGKNRKVPRLFNIIKQHIANGSTNELAGYTNIFQRIRENNLELEEILIPDEVKEKIMDCLIDRTNNTRFEVLPTKREANSWISKALKSEFIISRNNEK
ncbi:hypothetical protein NF27_DO00040 [Candidatus Jidaibacter acanthamoeba]|uniref:Uncharacterized protein n=2 Tax=Candidatus Jidaibacter acanthamoebae TaxID=86105 RepID=A0A0C1MUB1_9RICK|nr:hypothetical protein NF27_DO00040 [Candidatus Jidaibacter acanthamoeba]